MAGVSLIARPLNILGTIVLARLLDPSDFGAVALAMVLLGTTYMFIGLGMGSALIHSNEDQGKAAFQAFVVTVCSGLTVFLFLKLNVQLATTILGDLDVAVFSSLLPLVLLSALMIVPEAMLKKQLLFGRVSIGTISGEITYMVVAIVLAWLGYGLWSLVYARLSAAFLKLLIIWISNPTWAWLKPKRWDWALLKSLVRYGLPITGGGLVSYFHTHWDDWFVGRQFGTQSLGYYTKAYDLSNKTLSSLSRSVINGVFFPSYARIRDDRARMRRVFLKGIRVVLLMMVPISLGLLVMAPQLVPVLLGEKWIPMIPTLQVYSFMVLFRPISSNTVPLFMGSGRPRYVLYAGLVLSVIMVPSVLLLAGYGIVGVALGVVISHIVGAGYNLFQVNRIIPGTIGPTLRSFVPFLVVGIVMAVVVQLLKPVILPLGAEGFELLAVLALVAIGAVVYLVLIFLVQKDLVIELVQLFISALGLGGRFSLFKVKKQAN